MFSAHDLDDGRHGWAGRIQGLVGGGGHGEVWLWDFDGDGFLEERLGMAWIVELNEPESMICPCMGSLPLRQSMYWVLKRDADRLSESRAGRFRHR